MTGPALVGLRVGGSIRAWAAAGFIVISHPGHPARIRVGAVTLQITEQPGGVESWSLPAADGLLHAPVEPVAARHGSHPNRAVSIDHVVIASPDLDRTTEAFEAVGLDLRRTRDAGRMEQRFFRTGEVILEVIGQPGAHDEGPATFWGLAVTVGDLDAAAAFLRDHLGPISDAVQRGRRIATLRHEPLGLAVPIAFMTAPPSRDPA